MRRVDEPARRAVVVESELRVRRALAAGDPDGPDMPALAVAIRGLRVPNRAVNEAKHTGDPAGEGGDASPPPL